MILRLILMLLVVLVSIGMQTVHAADYEGATVTLLRKSLVTEDGKPIVFPKSDRPEVSASLVELPAGGQTGWHQHQYPLYAFVLSGTIMVELDNGTKKVFCEGDVIIEVVNRVHNGRNTGTSPVKLLVFVTGEQGAPMSQKELPPAAVELKE